MNLFDLRQDARHLILAVEAEDRLPLFHLPDERVSRITPSLSLQAITESICAEKKDQDFLDTHERIVVIEACLRSLGDLEKDKLPHGYASDIQNWTIQALLPPREFARPSPFDSNPPKFFGPLERTRWRLMASTGLRLLTYLQGAVTTLKDDYNLDLITCLASFTDIGDPWTRPESLADAKRLLDECLQVDLAGDTKRLRHLLANVLEVRIKPLFSKNKSEAITQHGRKAISPLSGALDTTDSEVENKPWKFQCIYTVTIFQWILDQLETSMLEANWPLVIPPLLALLDDPSTDVKIRGCGLLVLLLKNTPSSLLQRTGLGAIFHDALMPCLSYLPTLTPEDESLRLLESIYPTLLTLVRVRFSDPKLNTEKGQVLDKILRVGILNGYAHAGEHIKIAVLLMERMADVVDEMGITSVKHLKYLLPLISNILSDPFALAHPALLRSALWALQIIILNDWPRIDYHRGEVLKGLVICWCRTSVDGHQSANLDGVKHLLRENLKLLIATLHEDIDSIEEVSKLLTSDLRLEGLWQP